MTRGSEVRPGLYGGTGPPEKNLRAGETVSGVVTFSIQDSGVQNSMVIL